MREREHEKGVLPAFFKLPVEQFADERVGCLLGDEQAGRGNSEIEKRLKGSKLNDRAKLFFTFFGIFHASGKVVNSLSGSITDMARRRRSSAVRR